MVTRRTYLIFLPLILIVLMACQATSVPLNRKTIQGSGKSASEMRPVSNIERVSLRDFGEMVITQGDSESLTVEADDNLLPHIKTEMRGRELILQMEEGYNFHPSAQVRYTLKVKDLNRISISGAANVKMDSLKTGDFSMTIAGAGNATLGTLKANDLSLELSGTGKLKIDALKADKLDVQSSGAGDFNMTGEVSRQNVTISGAGNYKAGGLKSSESDLRINGAGNMTVWVEQKLSVNVAGFGSVSYYGKPNVTQSIAGGGDVKSLGVHQ